MKPVVNRLKKFTESDAEFVMEVIQFAIEKYHKDTKSTSCIGKKGIFKLLSELDVISTPEVKKLYPELGERSLRYKTSVCRSCIRVVS